MGHLKKSTLLSLNGSVSSRNAEMRLIYADGMANTVDPDQTFLRNSPIGVYAVYLEVSVRMQRILRTLQQICRNRNYSV